MLRYALICVNYNAYPHLTDFMKSVEAAAKRSGFQIDIYVVDNSTERIGLSEFQDYLATSGLSATVLPSDNVGYFPAAEMALRELAKNKRDYDYVSVSNVDLRLDPAFFSTLESMPVDTRMGVLAPSIISDKRKSNLNPKIVNRPSRASLMKTAAIFQYPWLFIAYQALSNIKSIVWNSRKSDVPEFMYAPHGSFIVFTRRYLELGGNFSYPRFLFGEEIFVAESCRRLHLKIRLAPELKVHDIDHGSTSLQSARFISGEHTKSLRYLLKTYFSED
jgi:hypothetical protein